MDEQSFEINRVKRFEYSCDSISVSQYIHARNHDSLLMCKFVQRYNSLVSFIETVKRWSIEYSIDKCLPLIFLTLSPASDIDFTNQFLNYNLVGTQDKHFWGEWKECTSRQRIEIVAELIRIDREDVLLSERKIEGGDPCPCRQCLMNFGTVRDRLNFAREIITRLR